MNDRPQHDTSPVTEVLRLASNLLRGEVALARAEIAQNFQAAAFGLGLIVTAAVLLMVAVNLAAASAVMGVAAAGVPDVWAPLVVAFGFAALALLLARLGAASLRLSRLAPKRTAARLRRTVEILKETITDDPQT
jgi:hypothetical protein